MPETKRSATGADSACLTSSAAPSPSPGRDTPAGAGTAAPQCLPGGQPLPHPRCPLTSRRSLWDGLATNRITDTRSGVRTPHSYAHTSWPVKGADDTQRLPLLLAYRPTAVQLCWGSADVLATAAPWPRCLGCLLSIDRLPNRDTPRLLGILTGVGAGRRAGDLRDLRLRVPLDARLLHRHGNEAVSSQASAGVSAPNIKGTERQTQR